MTVLTQYDDYHINIVKEAFKKANLNDEYVIKVPEAIVITYGYFHKKKLTTILTIDIGGGNFGISILKIQEDSRIQTIYY